MTRTLCDLCGREITAGEQTYYILIEANRTWSPKAEGRWPDVCKGCMNKVLARISNIVAEEVRHD